MLRNIAVLLVGVTVAGLAGCGGKPVDPNRPKTVPASVTITYQGQPVADATVTLQPTSGQPRGAMARTDAEGKAVLWTYDPGDGVIPGAYKVTVIKQPAAPDTSSMTPEEYNKFAETAGNAPPPQNELPAKYADANASDLTLDVAEGADNNATFELKD